MSLNAELEKTVAPGTEVKMPLEIKNTSKNAIRLAVRPLKNVGQAAESFALCLNGNCWEDLSSFDAIDMAPGQTLEGLLLKFRAGYDANDYHLELSFYNADNPLEKFSRTFKFSVNDNFSNGILFSQKGVKVGNAYPNPAVTAANIDYQIADSKTSAKIVIHNLLGNKVMELPLEIGEMNVKISTDALDNGIYFYSLHIDGKRVATKKIVVKK